GKGYYQKGDEMVCRNCGRRFASVLVNEVQGGCNPAPLNRRVEGDQLILRVEDILTGKSYFNFKEKV
ncbi:MAG: Fe-S-containing protein, partial [Desulfobacteraceae bacterium]